MRRHLDSGYTMVKMKVGGAPLAEDMSRIEAVKAAIGNRAQLAVDANSKFERDEAIEYAKAMSPTSCAGMESRATRSTSRR